VFIRRSVIIAGAADKKRMNPRTNRRSTPDRTKERVKGSPARKIVKEKKISKPKNSEGTKDENYYNEDFL